ncbi:MAG: Uma2 family endonuclease [Deltaproteobacteria bacterium]|nr:Uma2 family endonuclease [Deltaproteobacteria bacterium]
MSVSVPDPFDQLSPAPARRRFTRAEYDRLVADGFFDEDEKLELLDGEIVAMTPQGSAHSKAILRLNMLLAPALAGRAGVAVQLPFAASDDSEPEPDVFILPLADISDDEDHPSEALCVIEVAVTSQRRDRYKAGVFARASVPQLILIDVPRRVALVHRAPRDGEYERIETVREGTPITIDAFPDLSFDLARVLPRAAG